MSKVKAQSAVKAAQQMIHRLKPDTRLDIVNFKKDRMVYATCAGADQFVVDEEGFFHEEWRVDEREAASILKDIIPREFPRSHELRFSVKNLKKKV